MGKAIESYVTMNKPFIKSVRINFVQKVTCFKCSMKINKEFHTKIIQI